MTDFLGRRASLALAAPAAARAQSRPPDRFAFGREALSDVARGTGRQDMAMRGWPDSPSLRRLGLGVAQAPHRHRGIDALRGVVGLGERPTPDRCGTGRFLPPAAERARA